MVPLPLRSRKFLLTVGAVFVAALNRRLNLGLTEAEVVAVVGAVAAYALGQGYVDGQEAAAGRPPAPAVHIDAPAPPAPPPRARRRVLRVDRGHGAVDTVLVVAVLLIVVLIAVGELPR